jgi:vitamin B12 transporter
VVKRIYILLFASIALSVCAQDPGQHKTNARRDINSINNTEFVPFELKTVAIYRSDFSQLKSNQQIQSIPNIYQKNYGDGQLSTIQFRGFSGQHNDVEWRGIPLNSPFNGTVDLSTIPFPLGRSCNSFRNLGNAISINTTERELPTNKSAHELSINARLYNFYNLKYHYAKQANDNLLQVDADIKKGANNFRFTDNGISRNIINNDFEQYSFFINHAKSTLNKNKSRLISLWYTHTNRNIPPAIASANSAQHMKDNTLRLSIMHQNNILVNHLLVELSQSNYTDPNTQIFGNYANQSIRNKLSFAKKIKQFEITAYSLASLDFLQTNNYLNNQVLFNHLINVGISKHFGNHEARVSLTTIEQNEKFSFLLPSFYHQYDFFHRNYHIYSTSTAKLKSRFANGNDMFWNGAGNPNLKPEWSYQAENTTQFDTKIKDIEISLQCRSFLYYTRNLIYWTPNSSGLWTPQNIHRVVSYGFNPTLLMQLSKKITIENSYQYNPALVLDEQQPDIHQKQLLYSPIHKISSNLLIQLHRWTFELGHIYTSSRYYTTDNFLFLNPYHLVNAAVFYRARQIEVGLKCNNLLNSSYQEIANRAMPGILPSMQIKYSRR